MSICYIPVKGVDDVIASQLGWTPTDRFNPAYRVATLRGMYDEYMQSQNKEPLDLTDLTKATQELKIFRQQLARRNHASMSSAGTNLHVSYVQLRQSFTAEERFNRVNMLASMFSRWVDRMRASDPSKSRSQFISGFTKDGKLVAGEFAIFEMMFGELIDMQSHYMSLNTQEGRERAQKISQILNNWSALTAFTRMKLRDTEGVKIGNSLEWSEEAVMDNFGENNIAEIFDASESKREGWHEVSDMQSAFGSIGKQVRRLISCLPMYEESEDGKISILYDDLGHPVMQDPVKVHQTLMEDLRGVVNEEHMMRAFFTKDGRIKHPWLKPIVETLRTNNVLRTQFFVDFKKSFQPYSILTEDKDPSNKGLKVFKTKLLNKVENLLSGAYLARVYLGTPINSATSVFDTSGNINWENLQKVRSSIIEWLDPKIGGNENALAVAKWYNPKTTRMEKRAFLRDVCEALGIPMDADTVDSIMNSNDLKEFLNNLKQSVQYGIEGNLKEEDKAKLKAGDFSLPKTPFKSFLNAKNKAGGSLKEKVDKLLTIITKNKEGLRLDSRVRHKDSKGNTISLFSNINPSYMGDRFTIIKSYVDSNDKAGLRKFLEEQYLQSSYFRDSKGTVLNAWIEELLKCCDGKEDLSETFAAQFDYLRDLGSATIPFEDFTSKQHTVDMLTRFFADKQISANADTADYPVFILGDSGVSKYIKAKVYSAEDVLNGMYKVWRQEKRRMMLTRAANEYLAKLGHEKGIDNFSDREIEVKTDDKGKVLDVTGEYTMLPFLNDPKYASLLGNQTEAEVKNAITKYMKDAMQDFNKSLRNMGLLETKKVKVRDPKTKLFVEVERYVHLPKNITANNIDSELAKFYWNTKFATIQQLQLMTIDVAFYQNTKDLQKRYKEIHAPGQGLSITALDKYGRRYSETGYETAIYFDDISLSSEKTNPKFFAAVKSKLGKSSWEKYLKNTLTDGQGYRSLRSYRKVMGMAGLWTEEMESAFIEIENIKAQYQKNKIPKEELKKIADLAVVFQPIKPYLFTHEVLPVNNNDKLFVPVQHKYAEAVLIPELLPYGSQLRDMAYYMEENDIDLLASTKVVKVGAFGATNIKGVTNAEELNSALGKAYVHKLSYEDYRIQTNVPDHVQSARLFGTQLRKLIMAGIKMDNNDDGHYSSYVPSEFVNLGGKHGKVRMNGRNLISFYNSLIVANIMSSFTKFSNATEDVNKLSERLIQGVINNSRESMDNILSYGVLDEDFAVPLFEAGLEHDASAMVLSMFKKMVNKQTIQGNPLVQVSALGISGYAEDGDLEYVTDDSGNVLYAECEIPWDLSYVERDEKGNERVVPLEFNDYCYEDGTLKIGKNGVPLIEEKLPGVTSFVAYRIPTERDYSMINLRVKRFSQKTAGGTIKVPPEGTTIAGFDFDVDKLYLMRREYRTKRKQSTDEATDNLLSAIFGRDTSELLEFEEYDFNKSPLENTPAARNNMLIHLIQQRLMDPETFDKRYTPGGFAGASKSARVMRELLFGDLEGIAHGGNIDWHEIDRRSSIKELDPEPNYDPSDPMTMIIYNQQNQVAGKLIGIFANQNTNHAFASLMKKFKLSSPISFAGHSYDDFLNAPAGVDVDLTVAEFLSASVDAVKDPVLNFMNLNTITADAGAVLARLGYTTQEIGLLFNQPIIREVCDYCFNNSVSLAIALRDVKAEYLKTDGVREGVQGNPSDFTIDKLAQNIITDRVAREDGNNAMNSIAFVNEQLKVLELFNGISTIASSVSQFVTSTKFTASNAVGSTFGDLYAQQMRVNAYLSKENPAIEIEVTDMISSVLNNSAELILMKDEDYFDTLIDNPFAYEQAMYDANRRALRHLAKFFPYDKQCYSSGRNFIANLTKSGTLDADTINSIHSDLLVYLLSQQEFSDFNGELPKLGTGHTNPDGTAPTMREYYTKFFASDVFKELEANPSLKELAIFKYLLFDVGADDTISMNVQGIGGLAPYQKDEIRESWADLNRTHPLIARDLFLYNFYKLGFQFGPGSFMNLAPTEVKQALQVTREDGSARSYIEFLDDIRNDKIQYNVSNFAIQYMLNHLDNDRLVFNADKSKVAREWLSKHAILPTREAKTSFTVDITSPDVDSELFLLKAGKEINTFKPVITIKGAVYVAQSGDSAFNVTKGKSMTYVLMSQQGAKGKSMSYYGLNPVEKVKDIVEAADQEPLGNTSQDPGDPQVVFNKEEAVVEIATEMAKALEKIGYRDELGEPISASSLIEGLKNEEDAILQAQVEAIRKGCRENGILLLDAEGNILQGC